MRPAESEDAGRRARQTHPEQTRIIRNAKFPGYSSHLVGLSTEVFLVRAPIRGRRAEREPAGLTYDGERIGDDGPVRDRQCYRETFD